MIKIIPTYIGICIGTVLTLTLFRAYSSAYTEGVYFPPWFFYFFEGIVCIFQISILMFLTSLFAKRYNLSFFTSPYYNFGIGMMFSLIYLLVVHLIPIKPGFFDSVWFILVVLPVIIFVPLLYMDYLLLYKWKRE